MLRVGLGLLFPYRPKELICDYFDETFECLADFFACLKRPAVVRIKSSIVDRIDAVVADIVNVGSCPDVVNLVTEASILSLLGEI